MELLTEKVCFIREKDFCAFNLSQVEALRLRLFCGSHDRIAEGSHVLPELLGIVDYLLQNLLFIGLEGQRRNLILPGLQIFQLGSSGITRNPYSPVADRTGILLVFLHLAPSNLQAFTMIPDMR